MAEQKKFTHSPPYFVLLVIGVALFAVGWIGERQESGRGPGRSGAER